MEIIHVILGKANPERMNGVNKVVHQLVTRQVQAGYTAAVWGITHDLTHNYPARSFETKLFRAFRWPFRLDESMLQAMKEKAGKAVFHLHGGFNPVFYPVSRQLHKAGIPFVFTPHGAYNRVAMRKSWLRKRVYLALFESRLLRNAGYVHCLGNSEVEGLNAVHRTAKPLLLPYGFERKRSLPASPESNGFVIGFCGRLDIYTKGLDLLLQAYAVVKNKLPQASLWIIGDGEGRAALESAISRMQLKNVWMAGSRFGEEKDGLLRLMHVFAHPSRNEGLPSAVLEAAALGIPCVITEATNLGKSVAAFEAGVVIDQPDAAMLTEALLGMYERTRIQKWPKVSSAARNMVSESFNWDKIIAEFGKMYATVWHRR